MINAKFLQLRLKSFAKLPTNPESHPEKIHKFYSTQSTKSKMPSRNNPNKQSRTGKRGAPRHRVATAGTKARGIKPTGPKVDKKGLIRGQGVSKKKERKKLRNVEYAQRRAAEMEELSRLVQAGEVEMKGLLHLTIGQAKESMKANPPTHLRIDATMESISKTMRKKLEKQEAAVAAKSEGNIDAVEGESVLQGGDDVDMVVE